MISQLKHLGLWARIFRWKEISESIDREFCELKSQLRECNQTIGEHRDEAEKAKAGARAALNFITHAHRLKVGCLVAWTICLSAMGAYPPPIQSNPVTTNKLGLAPANGWFLTSTSGVPKWTINGGLLTNITGVAVAQGTNIVTTTNGSVVTVNGITDTNVIKALAVSYTNNDTVVSNGLYSLLTSASPNADIVPSGASFFDDLLGVSPNTSPFPGNGIFAFRIATTGSSDIFANTGATDAPGIWRMQPSSASYCSLHNFYFAEPFVIKGVWTNEWRFQPVTANQPTPNQNYELYIGFGNTIDGTRPTSGSYLAYDTNSTSFQYISASGSTYTTNSSGVTASAGTWYKLRIVCTFNNTTNFTVFTIDGAHTATNTTTQPNGRGLHMQASAKKIDGGGNAFIDLDYCFLGYKLDTSR